MSKIHSVTDIPTQQKYDGLQGVMYSQSTLTVLALDFKICIGFLHLPKLKFSGCFAAQ